MLPCAMPHISKAVLQRKSLSYAGSLRPQGLRILSVLWLKEIKES